MIRAGRFRLRSTDRGFAQLMRVVASVRDLVVTIGVHADRGAEQHRGSAEGVTVADVAGLTEFGADGGGSWIRGTVDARRDVMLRELDAAVRRGLAGPNRSVAALERELRRLGDRWAEELRTALRQQGLVSTGHLSDSIEGRVAPAREAA